MSKLKLYALALALIACGIGLMLYKHYALGFPLMPGDKTPVWTIEAKIEFIARGDPVIVNFTLPNNPPDFVTLNEGFASSGFGFSQIESDMERKAQWTARSIHDKQALYYRLDIYEKPGTNIEIADELPKTPEPPELDEPFRTAAKTLVDDIHQLSANAESFTSGLIQALNASQPEQNVRLLIGDYPSTTFKTKLTVDLLSMAGIPSRIARGLFLEGGRRRQSLVSFIEIHNGIHWQLFDPETGVAGRPKQFILWQRGEASLLDVIGGQNSKVHFSMIKNVRATQDLAVHYAADNEAALIDFSIYSLPIEEQNAFKYILLIPIGALVVVFMRILVGIHTSGTFMPILIALAFIKTSLVTGLLIFILVVGTGLIIRSYLSRLNLLLVARISAVIIVVVAIMSAISIISQKLGFSQALTVTFFPMIILAWTIERMSILWEEEGPKQVLIQGSGSLLVAVLAYLCMTNRVIEYLTFNFPELLLVNLGLILILGQYTGYRLAELRRFQPMTEKHVSSDSQTIK